MLAEDIVNLLSGKTNDVDEEVRGFIEKSVQERKANAAERAKKAKEMAKRRMMKIGQNNKYKSMMKEVKEEVGPKCVTCEDGYSNKPSEILGVYVFTKKASI